MEPIKNRIVVKVGTTTLTADNGTMNFRTIDKLAQVVMSVQNLGYEIILVTSGAIAVGKNKMRLDERPRELRLKQAAAAVGQCELMHFYDKFFLEYGGLVAQILLNSDDVGEAHKRENLINTFETLLEKRIIPIVNENDSIAYTEIESDKKIFGDNDTLSAIVATLCHASKLIILSDIEGLFDGDPRINPDASLIRKVSSITEEIRASASGSGSNRGTGGMVSKLDAAELMMNSGGEMYITLGSRPENIYDILEGRIVGTRFKAE